MLVRLNQFSSHCNNVWHSIKLQSNKTWASSTASEWTNVCDWSVDCGVLSSCRMLCC